MLLLQNAISKCTVVSILLFSVTRTPAGIGSNKERTQVREETTQDSGWRGSRNFWLDAAYEAFVGKGIEAVKIANLAKELKIARTSFYWHFKDRNALLDALWELWSQRTTVPLLRAIEAESDSAAHAMLNVIGCFVGADGFDSQMEFAIRGWALADPVILDRLRQEDEMRLEALASLFRQLGKGELEADVRARNLYLVQIGYISMQVRETLETRIDRVPHYVEIFSDEKPTSEEMNVFCRQMVAAAI
ncbi:MAG: TetR/AcrR family transcriptional regulator [Rhodobacteraceae bacterium]|nr:TetR/AcrR family transcriptional regulator [Paracoccaceae bacterium]